jgi:2-dehydropantoate 2-reductase
VRHVEGTRFAIGEPDGTLSERCRRISEAFVAGGLKCPVESNIREQMWLKLVGNAAFNPVTALTGATLGELGALPEMVDLLRAMLEECGAVAAALGIELPVSLERRLEAGIAVGDHKTSMLQDLEAGKPLEVDCLTGAVGELASLVDVPVPHTRSVHACIKMLDAVRQLEAGRVEAGVDARSPQ